MRIGEVADATRLSTATIRYDESIGLVAEPACTGSGYRDYPAAIIERLRFVKQAQRSGLTLAEVSSILEIKDAGGQSCEHTRQLVRRHLSALTEQIDELERQRQELQQLAERADLLDPSDCTDAQRCQVITGNEPAAEPGLDDRP